MVPPELSTIFGVNFGGLPNFRKILLHNTGLIDFGGLPCFRKSFTTQYAVHRHLMSIRVLIDYGQGKCMEVHWEGLKSLES